MDSVAPVIEQMTLDLSWEDHVPGDCEHEQAVADIGGGKSLCGAWGCWTNCREVGHCVYEDRMR